MTKYRVTPEKVRQNAPLLALMLTYMTERRYGQIDLAAELGCDHSTVSRWFANECRITRKWAARIGLVCGGGRAAQSSHSTDVARRLDAIWPELSPAEMAICESLVETVYQTHGKTAPTSKPPAH